MEKKHNCFYKTTNTLNGKYYYGIHSTNNLEDGYLGSGRTMIKAIKKYGKSNFTKEIIADYPTRKEASDHERDVVTLEMVNLEECYNTRTGGDNECTHSEETKKKMSEAQLGEKNHNFGKPLSVETKINQSKSLKGKTRGEKHYLFGKRHLEKTKQKMSEASKGKRCGEDSHMFKRKREEVTKIKISLNNPNRKPCVINGVFYTSRKDASSQLKIPYTTLSLRISSKNLKFKDWNYCEETV